MNSLVEPRSNALERPGGRVLLALLAVLAADVALSWRWMSANGFFVRPPPTEGAPYRVTGAQMMLALEDGGLFGWLKAGYMDPSDHTPLLPMVGGLVGHISGQALSPFGMWLTMMIFTVIFGLGTYWLARVFVPPLASVAVVALTLCAPVVTAYQREFLTSLPQVSFEVWTLGALLRSDRFGRTGWSLAFAGFAVLATFGKIIAPVYFIGPALLAAALGLRAHGARALRNVALVLILFAAFVAPWFLRNAGTLWGYCADLVSTEHVPLGQRLLSSERLLYYPYWFVNCGSGLPLATCVVLAALCAVLPRARLSRRTHAAWILALTVPTSLALVAPVQISGRSQYVILWVPLGALLVVHAVGELRGRARPVALTCVTLAAVWTLSLNQRDVHSAEHIVQWKGLHLVGGTGQYLATIVRTMNLVCSPTPERWPVEEFTEVMLDDCNGHVPLLASSHPIVTPNMMYETTIRRRALFAPKLPLIQFVSGSVDGTMVHGIDYLVTDSLLMDVDAILSGLAAAGIATEVLAERQVTPFSHVRLIALRHEAAPPQRIDPLLLIDPAVRAVEAAFEDGPRLRGAHLVVERRRGAGPALNLFFDAPEELDHCTTITLEVRGDGAPVWSGERGLPPLRADVTQLAAVCFDEIEVSGPPRELEYWVGCRDAVQRRQVLATEAEESAGLVRVLP